MKEDEVKTIMLRGTDLDGDNLTFEVTDSPDNGTLSAIGTPTCLAGAGGNTCTANVTFTPNKNFNGADSFIFTVSDGKGGTDNATVAITVTAVNDDPDAKDDMATTDEDNAVDVRVLANDTDTNGGDKLSITNFTQPENGTVTDNGDGTLRYTPKTNFNGTDTFEYTISDGKGGTDSATVTIDVGAVNDRSASKDDRYQVKEGRTLQVRAPGVLCNDTDTDGDSLSTDLVRGPKHGRLDLREDGSFAYRANWGFRGSDDFRYRACDAEGECSRPVKVTIKVLSDREDESGSIKKGHRNVGQGGGNR